MNRASQVLVFRAGRGERISQFMTRPTGPPESAPDLPQRHRARTTRAAALLGIGLSGFALLLLYTTDHRRQRTAVDSAERLVDYLVSHVPEGGTPPEITASVLAGINEPRGWRLLPVVAEAGSGSGSDLILACTVPVACFLHRDGRAVVSWQDDRAVVTWMTEDTLAAALARSGRKVIETTP